MSAYEILSKMGLLLGIFFLIKFDAIYINSFTDIIKITFSQIMGNNLFSQKSKIWA